MILHVIQEREQGSQILLGDGRVLGVVAYHYHHHGERHRRETRHYHYDKIKHKARNSGRGFPLATPCQTFRVERSIGNFPCGSRGLTTDKDVKVKVKARERGSRSLWMSSLVGMPCFATMTSTICYLAGAECTRIRISYGLLPSTIDFFKTHNWYPRKTTTTSIMYYCH